MDIDDQKKLSYKFIKLDSSLLHKLYDLHCAVYKNPVPKHLFIKKFISSDGNIKAIGFCASLDSNDIVAYYGVFPGKYLFRGKDIIAAQSGDTMTHPKHQGKGLFVELAKLTYAECKSQGIAFVWGIPNNNSATGFYRKLSWKSLYLIKSIKIIIPSIPIALLKDNEAGEKLYYNYINKLAKFLWINTYDVKVNISLPDDSLLVSNRVYNKYSDDHRYEFLIYEREQGNVIALLKVSKYLVKIGYIKFPSSILGKLRLIGKLFAFSFLSGSFLIKYYFSENTVQICNLSIPPFLIKDSLTCGAISFDKSIDVNYLGITYCDYDTY